MRLFLFLITITLLAGCPRFDGNFNTIDQGEEPTKAYEKEEKNPSGLLGNGLLGPYNENAYGPGLHSDGTGRPFRWQKQGGGEIHNPFLEVEPNAYGPGIGMDQYGRPVEAQPWP